MSGPLACLWVPVEYNRDARDRSSPPRISIRWSRGQDKGPANRYIWRTLARSPGDCERCSACPSGSNVTYSISHTASQEPESGPSCAAYAQSLAWLNRQINYEATGRLPYAEGQLRLEHVRRLLDALGAPDRQMRIVHVAGTKGKGSTSAMIAAMLQAAGHRTGLYSSPHLHGVEERMLVDGQPCTRPEFIDLVQSVRAAAATLDAGHASDNAAMAAGPALRPTRRGPTYFDITTAMALLHFARSDVDIAVLEVGMGGRLDSTNVCLPIVSVITSISRDHTRQLGNTLAAIAREKAGIIKPAVPVVSGVRAASPQRVIHESARRLGCDLAQLGRDFLFRYVPPEHLERAAVEARVDIEYAGRPSCRFADLRLSLLGRHQAANAATAVAAIVELRKQGIAVADSAIQTGLRGARLPARAEVLGRRPAVLLDAAHNRASAVALANLLNESFDVGKRVLIFASTRDKDVSGMLRVLLPRADTVIFTRYQANPRAIPPRELLRLAGALPGPECLARNHPQEAWHAAYAMAAPDHMIVVCGSFFLAAELRETIRHSVRHRADSCHSHGDSIARHTA